MQRADAALNIRPYLLDFLCKKCDLPAGEPLHLPGSSFASLHLTSLLVQEASAWPHDDDPPHDMSAVLRYTIPPQLKDGGKVFLSKIGELRFNIFLRRWMVEGLMDRVLYLFPIGVPEKDIIEGFIAEFELRIEFDALRKTLQRERERRSLVPLRYRNSGRAARGASLRQFSAAYQRMSV